MDSIALPIPAIATILALCGLQASLACADEIAVTTWHCWYQGQTRLACRLATVAGDGETLSPEALTDPLRAALPAAAQQVLDHPARLRNRTVTIPMFSSYEDRANAEDLADAVMCGARMACRVVFHPDIAAIAFLHETDPARD